MRYFRKDLMSIFMAVLLLFLFSALMDTRLDILVFERNQKIMENYEKINDAIMSYDESRLSFRLYQRNRDKRSLRSYLESSDRVTVILEELAPAFRHSERSQMNYRIAAQMLEHRRELIDAYISYETVGLTLSEDLEYIFGLSERISSQMNSLMSSYLNQMDELNEENMKWYLNAQALANGLTFLILVSLVLVTVFIVKRIRGKFLEATYVVKEIGKRNFSVKSMDRTQYEDINVYIDTMNDMKDEIRDLITQTEEYARSEIRYEQQKRLLAESRMKELQLQINPHFLFNTLSIVIRHIQFKEYETSIQLIKETSKILRNSLGKKTPTIPLDDEIELLNSYIFIQQLHLRDRVELNLDIRKAYGNEVLSVPPLVIQPLVENAVIHGMRETTQGGRISIMISEKTELVEVQVRDNGVGMPREILEKVRMGSYEGHIGLLNVRRRLELLYGREDVLSIESQENVGTTVTLNLFKRGQEHV